jgi:hypothetical protein
VGGGLGGQLPDPTGQAPQRRRGATGLHIPLGVDSQPGTASHQLSGRASSEPFPQGRWRGDDQGVELALGVAGGLDRRAAGGQADRQRGPGSGRSWLGELVAAEGFAGGPGRIQRVGPGAVAAGGPLGPVQLHHPLVMGSQEPAQPAP